MRENSVLWSTTLLQRVHNRMKKESADVPLFSTVAKEWLAIARLRVKESSYTKYYNLVYRHIIPELGSYRLSDLTTQVVEEYVAEKLIHGKKNGEGLSEKSVKDILGVLRAIGKFALMQNHVFPCHFELIKVRVKENPVCVLKEEEEKILTDFLLQDETLIKTGILLSLYMGMRLGEVCALRMNNILLEEGVVRVSQTMQRVQCLEPSEQEGEDKPRTKVIVTEPKSRSSCRLIPIPPFIQNRLRCIRAFPKEAYLLTGSTQYYIEPRNLENQFRRYLALCEIKRVNYHVLRHTFATRCIESGFDAKSLSEILGHASVNITLNRYVHASMNQKKKYMNTINV